MELDTLDAIIAQNKALSQKLASITKQLGQVQIGFINSPPLICDFFGGNHVNGGNQMCKGLYHFLSNHIKPNPNKANFLD